MRKLGKGNSVKRSPGASRGSSHSTRPCVPMCPHQTRPRTLSRREASTTGPNRRRCSLHLLQKTHQPATQLWETASLSPMGCVSKPPSQHPPYSSTNMSLCLVCGASQWFRHNLLVPDCHSPPFLNKSIFFSGKRIVLILRSTGRYV